MSEWVSAIDKRPKEGQHVLAWMVRTPPWGFSGVLDLHYSKGLFFRACDGGKVFHYGITHWMPLEPPKEAT